MFQNRQFLASLFFGFLCVAIGTALIANSHRPAAEPPVGLAKIDSSSAIDRGTAATTPDRKPIEQVRVGDRVHVDATDFQLQQARQWASDTGNHDAAVETIESDQWRQIELTMSGGGNDRFDIVLLRPLDWIEQTGAKVGDSIHLVVPEQSLDGKARVLQISDCPLIASGEGSVVTGTFTHERNGILDIYLEGDNRPLGVTGNHPVYSFDRQSFVFTDSLQPGERLQVLGGSRLVAAIVPRASAQRVYNLEVHGTHVYHVTGQGLLVHNSSANKGYRVMSDQEYNGAKDGNWSDSDLVQGDADEMGSKWLWESEEQAGRWLDFLRRNGDDGMITEVPTSKPLNQYPTHPHPPEGNAVHVPIEDLGPATRL